MMSLSAALLHKQVPAVFVIPCLERSGSCEQRPKERTSATASFRNVFGMARWDAPS